jgi:hypothetical protein
VMSRITMNWAAQRRMRAGIEGSREGELVLTVVSKITELGQSCLDC